ncbi:MAG: hypothetical protein AAGF12_31550 [Myxococcota bacterium]
MNDADAEADATPVPDATLVPDAEPPPMCAPECPPNQTCCPTESGDSCITPFSDPLHCGGCGIDCVGLNRGTACELSRCVCGLTDMGCQGTMSSFCCPPREAGQLPYCANLVIDGDDCGGCNQPCDILQADRCALGACQCGERGAPCAGTRESTCCLAMIEEETECKDLTQDREHCGVCGQRCRAGEACRDGACSVGDGTCVGGCDEGDVCCSGVCCARTLCIGEACTE